MHLRHDIGWVELRPGSLLVTYIGWVDGEARGSLGAAILRDSLTRGAAEEGRSNTLWLLSSSWLQEDRVP